MIKKLMSFVVALLLSLLLVNGVLFLYERPVAYISTPNGASKAIRRPYSVSIHGLEGYAKTKFDRNGYANEDAALNDTYVLMMGSSHTHAQEVAEDKKYSALVNAELSQGEEKLYTYNISCEGHFLPDIMKHFTAALQEYPNAKCITIEIGGTDYSLEQFQNALEQAQFDGLTSEQRFQKLGTVAQIKNLIKEYVPLLSIINSNMETARKTNSVGGGYSVNEDEYRSVITDCLTLIRDQFDGPIVFIYHPVTEIQKDGSIKIVRSQTFDVFKEVCEETKIDFIDTGDAFVEHYNKYHELPYGFANTTPGSDHLNEVGHKIMADAIIDYLEEVNCK